MVRRQQRIEAEVDAVEAEVEGERREELMITARRV